MLPDHLPEHWAAGGEDHAMGLEGPATTHQRDVKEVFVGPEIFVSSNDVLFEIIPSENKFVRVAHDGQKVFCNEIH